jgi:hypothetical protein
MGVYFWGACILNSIIDYCLLFMFQCGISPKDVKELYKNLKELQLSKFKIIMIISVILISVLIAYRHTFC